VYGNYPQIVTTLTNNIANRTNFDLVQGHMPYGAHYQLNVRHPRYFVFLREPVERTFSDINYSLRAPHHAFHKQFTEQTRSPLELIEIAKSIHYYRNNMTNYISGLYFTREAVLSDLHRAIDNLWQSELVGLSSTFEESLLLMAKKLGWKKVIAERLNSAQSRIAITDELRASANAILMLDQALYAVAQEINHQQLQQYGSFLQEAAAQLREIYAAQKKLAPHREYEGHMVGEPLTLFRELEAMANASSPLGRWIAANSRSQGKEIPQGSFKPLLRQSIRVPA